ncbi:MAG: hypothetical protein ACJAYJ_000904 [Saprospiraceae bacterium]
MLRDTDFLEVKIANSLIKDCEELNKILAAIVKSLKGTLKN